MPDARSATESAVVDCVRERGEATLRELCRAVDDDTGAVFLSCRRLDDEGVLRAVRPLVYELADGAETVADGAERAADGAETAAGASPDGTGGADRAPDADSPVAPSGADDGAPSDDEFDWVSFEE